MATPDAPNPTDPSQVIVKGAREIKGDLICFKCYDKMDIPICSACKTPIDQERVVYALGKQWHVEVFKLLLSYFIKFNNF